MNEVPRNALHATQRDYWIAQLVGWGGLTVISILSSSMGSLREALIFALAKTFCMATGLGLSHLWRHYLRQRGWLDRNRDFPFRGLLAGLMLLSVVQTGFLALSDLLFRGGAVFEDEPAILASLLLLVFLWFVVFLIWTLCYAVTLSRRRAVRFELEKLELEVSVKDAELRALQDQVNPHFFFNSLNSIRALIYQDADAAAAAVSRLAGMMRHNLQQGRADTVPLAEELDAVGAYLEMEKLRFEERLQSSMAIEAGLEQTRLPPMVLQTLVENAVKHGVERSTGPCELRIAARSANGNVLLTVANQGCLSEVSSSTRLGLANAAQRLTLLFGPLATCTLVEADGWVIATVVLPQAAP